MYMNMQRNTIQECLLSYIVIVYNTDLNLLKRCLDSIEKNSYKTEIIIIDDGSTKDGIRKLCEQYKNMKYIYKNNGGPGSARNEGILLAKGKYVFFIDSDDYILNNPINLINLENNHSDIIFLNYFVESNKQKKLHSLNNIFFENNTLINQYLFKGLLGDYNILDGYTIGAIWNKLFRRKFLLENEIFYDINIPKGQDIIFVLNCLIKSPKLTYINKEIYIYYINNESICHKPNQNLVEYYDVFLKSLRNIIPSILEKNILKKQIIEECYEKAVINCLYSVLLINVFNTSYNINLKERRYCFDQIYKMFDKHINMKLVKTNNLNTFKEKVKIFCMKYRMFYILYLYQFLMNK